MFPAYLANNLAPLQLSINFDRLPQIALIFSWQLTLGITGYTMVLLLGNR